MGKKKWIYPLAAFLLPVLIVLIAYIAMGVFPFGDHAVMIIDSYHQYVPFFSEFHYKIWHDQSMLYSWHGSAGYNFLAVQAYYLASPLNFIIALFPADMMIEAFETLIVLKLAISGYSAWWYLSRRSGGRGLLPVLFSGFYALSGFMTAYNWNVMWLDSVAVFPFIIAGAEELIDKRDGRRYTIFLALAILCNYYIAIMICIFLVLYFFIYWFMKKVPGRAGFAKTALCYAAHSILAAGMAAVYLIPTYYTMINSSTGNPPDHWSFYRSFFDVFKQHFMLIEPTQLTGAPNLYSGVFAALLILLYIFCSSIPLRERILKTSLCAFLLVSTNVNVLDYIWHGLHFPNNLPGRFTFIYTFMLLTMAFEVLPNIRQMEKKRLCAAFLIAGGLFAACLWLSEEDIPLYAAVVTGIALGLYILLLSLYHRGTIFRKASRTAGGRYFPAVTPVMLLMLCLCAELTANTIYGLMMNGTITRSSYMRDTEDVTVLRDRWQAGPDTFYRMEKAQILGRNDIIRYNLDGLSLFSSTADDREETLMGALGFYNAGNKYSYKGDTPLTDALFAIRYVISSSDLSSRNMTKVDQSGQLGLYEDTQTLPVGFMVNDSIADWNIVEGMPFMIQNDFARLAAGSRQDIFTYLDPPEPEIAGGEITDTGNDRWYYDSSEEDGMLTFRITAQEQEDLYVYFEASHCENMKVVKDGQETVYDDQRGHIVHLGICEAGQTVILQFPMDSSYSDGNVALQLARFEPEAFDALYQELSSGTMTVTGHSDTELGGYIDADRSGILLLSIPYDKGWTAVVDGKTTDTFAVGEALTGINLEEGRHEISLHYSPQGLKAGTAVSILSLAIFFALAAAPGLRGRFRKRAFTKR